MRTIALPLSGRTISYREFGDIEHGFPIIFNHGGGNSSLFEPSWEKTQEETRSVGARVIAVDRPGVGDSTFYIRDGYASFASEIAELADALNVDNFAVAGFSSGGPNALAIAAGLQDRVKAVVLFSSEAPYYQMGDVALNRMHFPSRDHARLKLHDCIPRAAAFADSLSESYRSMKKLDRRARALADLEFATKHGVEGIAMDQVLEGSEWNFPLADVKQPVLMWHGTADDAIPVQFARHLESLLPSANAFYIQDEGHALVRRQWKLALESIVKFFKEGHSSKL